MSLAETDERIQGRRENSLEKLPRKTHKVSSQVWHVSQCIKRQRKVFDDREDSITYSRHRDDVTVYTKLRFCYWQSVHCYCGVCLSVCLSVRQSKISKIVKYSSEVYVNGTDRNIHLVQKNRTTGISDKVLQDYLCREGYLPISKII